MSVTEPRGCFRLVCDFAERPGCLWRVIELFLVACVMLLFGGGRWNKGGADEH